MKAMILSLIMIFGLTATNHGSAIRDTSFIQDPPLEDELYIDDIPFDTYEIACKYLLEQMVSSDEEQEVNDIPFDTRCLYNQFRMEKLTKAYKNEENVKDFPCINRRITTYTYLYPVKMEMPKVSLIHGLELKDRMTATGFSL